MTLERCNELFRTKYPEGKIWRDDDRSGAFTVVFKKNGKAYDYDERSCQGILGRFGFNVLYQHNIEAIDEQIEQLKQDIERGGRYSKFFNKKIIKTVDELKQEIEELEECKRTAILG